VFLVCGSESLDSPSWLAENGCLPFPSQNHACLACSSSSLHSSSPLAVVALVAKCSLSSMTDSPESFTSIFAALCTPVVSSADALVAVPSGLPLAACGLVVLLRAFEGDYIESPNNVISTLKILMLEQIICLLLTMKGSDNLKYRVIAYYSAIDVPMYKARLQLPKGAGESGERNRDGELVHATRPMLQLFTFGSSKSNYTNFLPPDGVKTVKVSIRVVVSTQKEPSPIVSV
jgi:hypothetical protein